MNTDATITEVNINSPEAILKAQKRCDFVAKTRGYGNRLTKFCSYKLRGFRYVTSVYEKGETDVITITVKIKPWN